jgi:hypothetical protein
MVVAVLAAMRVGSWVIGWMVQRFVRGRVRLVAAVANLAAFALFALLLARDLAPGEPLDFGALLFGLAVYLLYCCADFYWRPWKDRG